MGTIKIISRRAAAFAKDGGLYLISPQNVNIPFEVPAWIQETPVFRLMLENGDIEFLADKAEPSEPVPEPVEASEPVVVTAEVVEAPEPKKRTKRTNRKKDDAG